ncbi:FecR family protein [Mucilaginibacter sp. OK283]|uniref:FecR family protein n=1 Tax=Mucilaginibacter sp. OK283 TaxID=1881049 RepID=UPI0008BF6BD6|nr:FecR family protein [Mucilaginibacter sp. OK283]SEO70725.1 FecR family protein [Mucilaginibacter sp. OK283]
MQKQEFQQLIDKYLNGQATADEVQLLMELFDNAQTNNDWDEQTLGVKQDLEDKMLQRLQSAVQQSSAKHQPKVFKIFASRNVAAAVIGLMIISAGVYYGTRHTAKEVALAKNKTVVKHDADPGKNEAVLTLDNGEKVVLDSARIGTLAKKGNISIKKTKDGQLVYQVEEGKASAANGPVAYNTISTPRGGQYQVILPDGSKIWLNAASSLKFPTAFTGSQRDVELTGEAYFEVAKNPSKPFMVNVNALKVKVLGTHFNINAYADEDDIKTTLLEGLVQLTSGNNHNLLKPDEQGIVKGDNIQVVEVDAERAVAWKNGFFDFNRASIRDIMKQLSRWYNIEVVYNGKVSDDEFMGRIERNVKLSQVLHVLELSHVHFKVEDKKITVSP